MKKIFLIITTLCPTLLFAQAVTNTFTISGKIGNLNAPAKIYLLHQLGANRVIDSASFTGGNFSVTGSILDPSPAYIVIAHKGEGLEKLDKLTDVLALFLDKGSMTVNSPTDSVYTAKIKGSVINDESYSLTASLKPINEAAYRLNEERAAAPPDKQKSVEYQRFMTKRIKVFQDQQQIVLQSFVSDHPNSYLTLTVMNQLGQIGVDAFEMEKLYSGLSPEIKNSEPGKRLKRSIDISKITSIGATAPEFTQADVNGNPVALSSFKGKYVLIDFWASWCGPCRDENPTLVKTYHKFKDKNFTVLGVSLDKAEGKADWLKAIKTDGLDWTQVSDLKFWSNEVAVLYYVGSIPSNFLVDPNGKIVAKNLRGLDLEDKLTEILGKP